MRYKIDTGITIVTYLYWYHQVSIVIPVNEVVLINFKKDRWKKEREVFPCFGAIVKPYGSGAGKPDPAIPKEYIGKKILITVLEEDEEFPKNLVEDK